MKSRNHLCTELKFINMKKAKKATVCFQMDAKEKRELSKLAKQQGRTLSQLLRESATSSPAMASTPPTPPAILSEPTTTPTPTTDTNKK